MAAYPILVARAEEHVRLYARTGRVRRDPSASGVFGVVKAVGGDGVGGDGGGEAAVAARPALSAPSSSSSSAQQQPASASAGCARRSNWIAEIEADVQRTYVDRGFFLDTSSSESGSSAGAEGEGAGALCCSRWQDGGAGDGGGDGMQAQQAEQRVRLSRVLWAFALEDPSIKYCQGMNWVGLGGEFVVLVDFVGDVCVYFD